MIKQNRGKGFSLIWLNQHSGGTERGDRYLSFFFDLRFHASLRIVTLVVSSAYIAFAQA